jgi:UDP-N-acetylglucosamine 4,6-dehydratase
MGRSILITGCGYFTRHFVRQLLGEPYERICIYSRDEWKQARLRAELHDNAALRWFIGDVRDVSRLKRATRGVDVVVHGAALKRIETGAYNPDELVKTNVVGTMNVIEACLGNGVTHATLLSTDKAYQPVSPYGQSKALAESLFIASNDVGGARGTKFAVTRYGNVAGSTGSVIPIWREELKHGKTVHITDPEVTRFWMTPLEAVDMVLLAIRQQKQGLLLPGALPAFRLRDLSEAMGVVAWLTSGLPSYEKQHENLSAELCSKDARRMSVEELKEELAHVE